MTDTNMARLGLKEQAFWLDEPKEKMVGRSDSWAETARLIDAALEGRESKGIFIEGDYGVGKSFFLGKVFETVAKEHDAKDSISVLVSMTESEPDPRPATSFLNKLLEALNPYIVEAGEHLSDDELDAVLSTDLRPILPKLVAGEKMASDWLRGRKIRAADRSTLGVSANLDRASNCLEVLWDALRLFAIAEKRTVLVFIDEFEYLLNQYNDKKMNELLTVFKECFDRPITERRQGKPIAVVSFIFAMTPGAFELLTKSHDRASKKGGGALTAWFARFLPAQQKVTLFPLNEKDSHKVLENRIKHHQNELGKRKGGPYPFVDPTFFEVLFLVSGGVPRKLLQYAQLVLDAAARDTTINRIDGGYAKRILGDLRVAIPDEVSTSKDD